MTAGSAAIKNFSTWAMMAKKRHRSGSGGSKDHEAKKMTFLGRRNSEYSALCLFAPCATAIALVNVKRCASQNTSWFRGNRCKVCI